MTRRPRLTAIVAMLTAVLALGVLEMGWASPRAAADGGGGATVSVTLSGSPSPSPTPSATQTSTPTPGASTPPYTDTVTPSTGGGAGGTGSFGGRGGGTVTAPGGSGGGGATPPGAPVPGVTPKAGAGGATVDVDQVALGGALTIGGSGFTPGEQVQLVLYSTPVVVGSTAADESGAVRFAVTLPAQIGVGRHTAELTGWQSGHVQNVEFTVAGKAAPASVGLSGDQWRVAVLAVLAAILLAALLTILFQAIRRRRSIA